MLYVVITITMLIVGVTADNVHYVLANDKLCINLPCRELQYFIDNSQRYFVSNSKFLFTQGVYHHAKSDLIIQNVANISFIGINVNSSHPASISCFPEHTIKFQNVHNVTINNLLFESCGNLVTVPYTSITVIQPNEEELKFWASMSFIACINVTVSNVRIVNSIGYGLACFNAMGENMFSNITVVLSRHVLYQVYLGTCSNGMYFIYSGRQQSVAAYVFVSGVVLIQENRIHYCDDVYPSMIAISLKQQRFGVFLTISHCVFYQLNGNIIGISMESFAISNVLLNNCRFANTSTISSEITSNACIISVYYKLCRAKINIKITDCAFLYTNFDSPDGASRNAILYFEVKGKYECNLPQNDNMLISFSNVTFYYNKVTLLQVFSILPTYPNDSTITTIIAAGNFIVERNNNHNKLILLHNTKFYFTGRSMFNYNVHSDIIHSYSSRLIFSNFTSFYRNIYCTQLITLNDKWQYIVLKDNATMTIAFNDVLNEIISISKVYNHPFQYCLFQFISSTQDNFQHFNISLSGNREHEVDSKRSNSTLNKLSAHCKQINETAFQGIDRLTLYSKIIDYEKKLSIHTSVCYCQQFPYINCSVNKLGPIYPGQVLTIDLCLPYNYENFGLLYAETHNNNLPLTACKVIDQDDLKHTFTGNQTKTVHFTIASNFPTRCELFLTAQPDLYTHYDVFDVRLLPCPLGFAFQHGVCDCDPLLSLHTEKCFIRDQTVKRLPNHWITGNTSSNATKYLVSDSCPNEYCSHELMVNVYQPDAQCQQHRTGLLCSHCTNGYSTVFGSSKCKKCTNKHLTFILLVMLTGILLVMFLFVCNLTVTTGTVNGIILFVNIVEINGHLLDLQNRLVDPLLSYLVTANLGMCFEMCFYEGMDIYVKKWLQLTYPTYLTLIATLFIIASRYSSKLYRLTHNRSLPVLATLFMLTYTDILLIVSSIFLYTSVTSLPDDDPHIVWSLDPDIPLLGWKMLLLIIVCLLLFSFLVMLNAVLLFTKLLMRFKIIHRFKPIIDAFQGPFKHQYYYWIGLQLLLRNIMFLLSASVKEMSINIGCIIIVTYSLIHSYIQPYKSKMINFQETLLLYIYIIMCILLLFNGSEFQNAIILNAMVGLSLAHFVMIIIYHVFTYIICATLHNIKWCRWYNKTRSIKDDIEIQELVVNFQEPLLGQD